MTPSMDSLAADQLAALIAGVGLLGSGGGGDAAVLGISLERHLARRPVPLIQASELPADAWVMPVGYVGATALILEKLPSGAELTSAAIALHRWTGERPTAVMPMEAGGVNGLAAVIAGAVLGLPVVDADLMGRALPRLDQLSLAVCGLPITPCVLTESGGRTVLIADSQPARVESVVRAVVAGSSGWGHLAIGPIDADTVRSATIHGSLSRAVQLGRALIDLREPLSPADLAIALGGRLLGVGRVSHVQRRSTRSEFTRGSAVLIDHRDSSVLRLELENEYLAILRDGEMVATCPDLIAVLDTITGSTLQTELLRVGQEVAIFVIPGPDWWTRSADRLAAVGPRAFGIDHDPVLVDVP